MKYRYRAVKNGVLSEPYRYVKAGELVILDQEVKSSWLVREEKYATPVDLPITSASIEPKQLSTPNAIPPVPSSPAYTSAMESIKNLEAQQDGQQAPVPTATVPLSPAVPTVGDEGTPSIDQTSEEAPQAGTGNQDVL